MARFGNLPVKIPEGVKVEVTPEFVKVTGPKGSLERKLTRNIKVLVEEGNVIVKRANDNRQTKAMQGTIRSHIKNMFVGVTEGWSKTLELVGAGYRAEVRGNELVLTVGFSHPVSIKAPEGVKFEVEKNKIKISGVDKDLVGQVSAMVRAVRKPEPYKGKGIKYEDEVIRRKAGKQTAKTE